MDKQYDKRIRWARRRSESENTHWFNQNDLKKISNWKTEKKKELPHNLPTDDMENINSTKEIYNSLTSRGLFPEE